MPCLFLSGDKAFRSLFSLYKDERWGATKGGDSKQGGQYGCLATWMERLRQPQPLTFAESLEGKAWVGAGGKGGKADRLLPGGQAPPIQVRVLSSWLAKDREQGEDLSPKEMETNVHTETCTWMITAALFIRAQRWKQPKCPSAGEQINKKWHIHIVEYYSPIKMKYR